MLKKLFYICKCYAVRFPNSLKIMEKIVIEKGDLMLEKNMLFTMTRYLSAIMAMYGKLPRAFTMF